MSLSPEGIEVGRCYLMHSGQVRRVIALDGDRVRYETRHRVSKGWAWHPGIVPVAVFASMAKRVVPVDWTPEMNEAGDAGRV